MPITLTNPISRIINDIGDTFVVEKVTFTFPQKAEFFWRIKTQGGAVVKQGTEELEKEKFTKFYNEEYKTHADLVNKVASLAGYKGVFNSENLI